MNCQSIEKSVFTDKQTQYIKNFIKEKFDALEIISRSEQEMMTKIHSENIQIEEALGRARYQIKEHDLRDDILITINNLAKKYNNKSVLNSMTFASYSNKYGMPKLPPHIDKHDNNVSMFYQLQSNTEWPLFVQQESSILLDNETLILNTRNVVHWREPKVFQDGEFVNMIFFHFHDGSKSMLTVQDRYDIPKPWNDIYNRISIEKYGKTFL
jgi:hypothetical protein